MATIPNPATAVAGTKLQAATWNGSVRDAINFLTARPMCVLSNSIGQSIPNAANTAVTFDTEALDSDSMHSTVTNTSRVTAVTAGWYTLSATVPFTINATGGRWAAFQINGVATSRIGFTQPGQGGAGNFTSLSPSAPVFLNVGDYAELVCFQNSGGALALDASTSTGGARLTALWEHS